VPLCELPTRTSNPNKPYYDTFELDICAKYAKGSFPCERSDLLFTRYSNSMLRRRFYPASRNYANDSSHITPLCAEHAATLLILCLALHLLANLDIDFEELRDAAVEADGFAFV